jgi:hypothetical protein
VAHVVDVGVDKDALPGVRRAAVVLAECHGEHVAIGRQTDAMAWREQSAWEHTGQRAVTVVVLASRAASKKKRGRVLWSTMLGMPAPTYLRLP